MLPLDSLHPASLVDSSASSSSFLQYPEGLSKGLYVRLGLVSWAQSSSWIAGHGVLGRAPATRSLKTTDGASSTGVLAAEEDCDLWLSVDHRKEVRDVDEALERCEEDEDEDVEVR